MPLGLLLSFVREDVPAGDVTSDSLLSGQRCTARIVAREEGVIAGLEEASALFQAHGVMVSPRLGDGEPVDAGAVIATLEGPARAVLLVERTALNILGRMSGIATMTRRLQVILDRVGTGCRIASTRKTAPGLRILDKKAVILGGGDPHRMTLSDGILIKDNHLALVPLEDAVLKAKAYSRYRKVEIEVQTPDEALMAARAGADILLLDNMSPAVIRECLSRLESAGLREGLLVEVSGGVTEENLPGYAMEGVDLISMGTLTHSVKNLDVSLEIIHQ
ncbi:MAG TPA: carboxylating nicotinate-nucleotide diphosphorylase [Methanolinea sp.]|nr:carboxylating nicotinate-nucleotide diphosphorylase [Methanolinea sp.]